MRDPKRPRFRLSIRTLMIAVALSAVFLLPLVWSIRQREMLARAQRDAQLARALGAKARAEAMRAMYAANIRSANAALALDKASSVAGTRPAGLPGNAGLWSAVRVNHPVLTQAEARDLDVEFSLVNDSDAAIDPKLDESQILINGKPLEHTGLILGNGPRDASAKALPPGDHLRFAYALGDYFKEPGTYRLSWKGAGFQSPEVVFRVLPDEKQAARASP